MFALIEFEIRKSTVPIQSTPSSVDFWIEFPTKDFFAASEMAQALCNGYRLGSGLSATIQSVQLVRSRRTIALHLDTIGERLAALRSPAERTPS